MDKNSFKNEKSSRDAQESFGNGLTGYRKATASGPHGLWVEEK